MLSLLSSSGFNGEMVETVRDSWRLVKISRDTLEIRYRNWRQVEFVEFVEFVELIKTETLRDTIDYQRLTEIR